MNKNVKRFTSIILAIVLCLSMSVVAMAAENIETEYVEKISALEEIPSTYATTVGSCVFSLNNFADGTVLKDKGKLLVDCSSGPTSLTYIALPKDKTGKVYIEFKNNNSSVELIADGKTHTTSIVSNGLQNTTHLEVEYHGADVPLVSISLVFAR